MATRIRVDKDKKPKVKPKAKAGMAALFNIGSESNRKKEQVRAEKALKAAKISYRELVRRGDFEQMNFSIDINIKGQLKDLVHEKQRQKNLPIPETMTEIINIALKDYLDQNENATEVLSHVDEMREKMKKFEKDIAAAESKAKAILSKGVGKA